MGVPDANDLDGLADLNDALFDAAGDDRAAALDSEHVLDGHEEGLVPWALRYGDVPVYCVHQLPDAIAPLGVAADVLGLQGVEGADANDGAVIETVLRKKLFKLQLDELQKLLVVHRVHLVERDDDAGHLYLAGEQDVLAGLGHGAVGGADDEDGAVHLRRAGDHVLDVVGVAGAVDVRVVPGVGLVFDVLNGDGDASGLLLGGVVDAVERAIVRQVMLCEHARYRRRQCCLAVVHVSNRAHVHVRLCPLKPCLCQLLPSLVVEPTSRFELLTSFLPRTRSTY